MTPELNAFFERSLTAERVGDAAEALAYHAGIPMFGRSRHQATLAQLVGATGELTPWIYARWIAYQSIRSDEPGSPVRLLARAAINDAMARFHGDLMQAAYDEGGDPVKVMATVMGESWGCQQLAVHEYGVLERFLARVVGGELAASADLARSWVGAAMGGYRIRQPAGACALSLRDLATDEPVEVLDLGTASVAGPGGFVIGRLVPSGTTPALMFDMTPLAVDEYAARAVARSVPPDGWAGVLRDAIDERRMSGSDLMREDYELMTDVTCLKLVEFGTRPADLARVMSQLREGRDEVGRAAFRILRSAAEGALDGGAAPYVAAAVLNVHAYGEAQRAILAPGQQRQWAQWAEIVPDPARGRLLHFAELTADAA